MIDDLDFVVDVVIVYVVEVLCVLMILLIEDLVGLVE